MSFDSTLLVAFFAAFLRCSGMVLAGPLFGQSGVPVMIRVFFSAALSLALAPLLYGSISVPNNLYDFFALCIHEIAFGVVIGFLAYLAISVAEMAGALLDLKVGLSMSAILAPNTMLPPSVIARFKFMLALMMLLTLNGHHIMIQAIASSYKTSTMLSLSSINETLMPAISQMSLIAVQIALPVVAVTFVVDVCLGILSRAVPQINVLMVGMPAKIWAGLLTLSIALPTIGYTISIGIDRANEWVLRIIR